MATDSIEIESVKAVLNEETGVTTVTIRYLDDIEDPLVFEIPAGAQGLEGVQGVGIDRIENILNENNERTGIRIYFTDSEMAPFEVPLTDGKDGISIKDVVSEMQADGSINLTFLDTDGNPVGEVINVPSGTKISEIKSTTSEDGKVEVEVFYTNGEAPHKFEINTRGVKDITTNLVNNQYVITFSYTDGTTGEVAFDRPAAWLSGVGAPNPDEGIDGDFYFDTANKLIYQKLNGSWGREPLIDLKPDQVEYTVTFVIKEDFRLPPGAKAEYTFKAGESFASRKYSVPVPVYTDASYEFAGWYTVDDEAMITVNHSNFTDLTPVSGNLTLYAHWKKV